jgi:hypothetical protein
MGTDKAVGSGDQNFFAQQIHAKASITNIYVEIFLVFLENYSIYYQK